MNRALLLKKARAAGYTGKADLASLTAWFAEQGMDTETVVTAKAADGTETRTKIADIWAKAASFTLEVPDADAEFDAAVSEDDPGDEDTGQKEAPKPSAKTTRERFVSGKGWASGPGKVEGKAAEPRDRRGWAKKQYDLRAKAGATVFEDADQAEASGAFFRLHHSEIRRFDYGQKKADIEIVEKAMSEKAMSETANVDGGILVPQEFAARVIWLTEKYGVARRLANVVPMARDFMTVPRKTGIITMAAQAENGTFTATANTYDGVQLTAKKWGALIQVSSELWEDTAVSIADEYANTFAEAQAIAEDKAYIIGDGSATYNGCTGLVSALPSGAYVSATGSGWSAYLLSDFMNSCIGVVENVNANRLAFLCSRQFFAQVMLKLAVIGSSSGYLGGGNRIGDVSAGVKLGMGAGSGGPDGMFMGFPVYFSQVMPTATAGSEQCPVYFGDFVGGSMIGDRRQLTIATSDQRYFDSDQYAIRGTSRFTVNIHGDGRATTYGPIVSLTSS